MDKRKILRYALVIVIGLWVWITWQKESLHVSHTKTSAHQERNTQESRLSTYSDRAFSKHSSQEILHQKNSLNRLMRIKTDVLDVSLSKSGDFIEAKLLNYQNKPGKKHAEDKVKILSDTPSGLSIAESGLVGQRLHFSSQKTFYTIPKNKDQLVVYAYAQAGKGKKVTKKWVFRKGEYAIQQTIIVSNTSTAPWEGSFYNQLVRKSRKPSHFYSRSYEGAALSSHHALYKRVKFSELLKEDVSQDIEGGWAAMQIPYFVTAWVPPVNQDSHYYSRVLGPDLQEVGSVFSLGYKTHDFFLPVGKSLKNSATLYLGPELAKPLEATAKGLALTIDYGWFWFLAKPMFSILSYFYSVLGNWGWSIVLITVAIKVLFYPLSAKSYKSMAKMRDLTPKLQLLREQYRENKQALGKETMLLYRREGVNPMGGCLPMLVQVPFFIALYHVLLESVQLRHAPFIFWLQDLSVLDPWHILPILMSASMFLQQKLSPPQGDPQQAKMMMLLPVVFLFVFWSFPSGLVLYWLTNNLLSLLQQWYVMQYFQKSK